MPSDRRLTFLLLDGLLLWTGAHTRQFFSFNPPSDYHTVVRKAQALSDSVWVARRPAKAALAIRNIIKTRFRRGGEALSVDTSSAEGEKIRGEKGGSKVFALTSSYALCRTRSRSSSSSFSVFQTTLPATLETKTTPRDPLMPLPASVYYTPPLTPGRLPQFRLCLGSHAVCSLVSEADRERPIQLQEKNFQARQAECGH